MVRVKVSLHKVNVRPNDTHMIMDIEAWSMYVYAGSGLSRCQTFVALNVYISVDFT